MKVVVLGTGGREHALAYRLSLDETVNEVFVYPGNAGMKITSKITIVGGAFSLEGTFALVKEKQIGLVVIGPEKLLFEGYVDELKAAGIPAFGPSQAAAFLEGSKIKSKLFMREFGIPTSDFEVVHNQADANKMIDSHPNWKGYVLKLSGPALGKGVVVAKSASEAKEAATQFFLHRPPGIEEGMVIEEKVNGREVSLFYICANNQFQFLASACDHKRLKNNDEGPNTGGMGAYSPCTWIDDTFLKRVEKEVVTPTLEGMISQGTPFSGVLFLGLMVNEEDYSLLEYNTRFGDPETQAFLPILMGNLAENLLASANGMLHTQSSANLSTSGGHSLHVVKAAKGYPGLFGETIESGQKITISKNADQWRGAHLFFAGVKQEAGALVTSGGRVLGVTGIGATPAEARKHAYQNLAEAKFSGEQFRTDIGGAE